ncbi:hypothetical protein EYC84_008788 [Monilinia fructicola]|uniref:Heterokaryon incompatibility domain-containing protein n=1 Tax=Monilinia fructicola TaxID=38448 RepID=A0A5M9JER3_MONFR|nr:hypothetical protein EYC84_008788 [Monilinia fructicola]
MFDDHFWIDYLCLDQKDKNEQSQQIARMGTIYSEAKEVIIWLGISLEQALRLQILLNWHGNLLQSKSLGEIQRELIDAANFVYYHEFWTRVWVVQEVGKAKVASIALPSSTFTFEFNQFKKMISAVADKREPHPPIMKIWALYNSPGKKYQIQDAWREFSPQKCTRPNDQLYGLLGIIAPHNDGSSPLEHIHVNYDRPLSDVLLDTVFEMRIQPSLEAYATVLDTLSGGKYEPSVSRRVMFTRDANSIEEYWTSRQTSPRHRDLAHSTLEVFDALNHIVGVPGVPRQNATMHAIFSQLFASLQTHVPFKPSAHDHALMIGIALVVGSTKGWLAVLAKDWILRRKPRLRSRAQRSPWRCAVHRMPAVVDPPVAMDPKVLSVEEYMRWYPLHQQYLRRKQQRDSDPWGKGCAAWTHDGPWDGQSIVRACGYAGESREPCDGSRMSFEMASRGFCLRVENRDGGWRLRVRFGDRDCMQA